MPSIRVKWPNALPITGFLSESQVLNRMLSITTRQLKMNSEVEVKLASLYDTDYQLWLMQTVAQLQARDFGQVDVEKPDRGD